MDAALIKDVGPTIVGAIGFGLALIQYGRAQRWKRSEFATGILDQLWSDERIRFACIALDWKKKTVMVGEQYKTFDPSQSFVHQISVMEEGLATEERSMSFAWPRSYYQECFDRFFEYLSLVDHYLEVDLFDVQDVKPLGYWLSLIQYPKYANDKAIFLTYARFYGFDGVSRLISRMRPQIDALYETRRHTGAVVADIQA
jgi:hypothetical protein